MIKINLAGQRKAKRRGDSTGQAFLLMAVGIVAAAAVLVFFLIHQPLAGEISDQVAANKKLDKTNKKLAEETKDYQAIKAAFAAAETRWQAIGKLDEARAVPAWLLYELSNILVRGHQPQLTEEMKQEIKSNPNRPWQEGWDAKHVWLLSFSEKGGKFTLEGGAQSDSDATQLALRLQASMFFDDVSPKGGGEELDRDSGLTFYKFTITGTVRY